MVGGRESWMKSETLLSPYEMAGVFRDRNCEKWAKKVSDDASEKQRPPTFALIHQNLGLMQVIN